MSAELRKAVKKALSELATGQRTSYTDELKSLFTSFLFVPSNNGLKDLWTATQAIVTSRFSPEFTGKTLALYLWNQNLSPPSLIACKPVDGPVTFLAWQEFLTLDPTTVDWTYLPQMEVSHDTEIELWSLLLAKVPSLELEGGDPQIYVRAFHSAGPTVLRNIRENVQKIDPKERESPVGCLNAFRKLFPALLSPLKPDDVSRAEEALLNLKSLVPYFEMDDVVFGKHYDFFDGQVQLKFNQLYTRALISRLFLPSNHECHAPETAFNGLYALQSAGDLAGFLKDLTTPKTKCRKWIPLVSEKLKLPVATNMFVRLLHSHASAYKEDLFKSSTYRAPIIAICNSSGVGKTRLALSTASSCISILICLRKDDSSGQPFRSFVADYLLDSRVLTSSTSVTLFLKACLMAWIELFQKWIALKDDIVPLYQRFYETDEENFLKIMGDLISLDEPLLKVSNNPESRSFHETYWLRVIELHGNPIKFVGPSPPKANLPKDAEDEGSSSEDFVDLPRKIRVDVGKQELQALNAEGAEFVVLNDTAKRLLVDAGIYDTEDEALFVITFDEARYLLKSAKEYDTSILRYLRHGSRPFVGGFIVLTDTLSQLSYISPAPRFDYSAKSSKGFKSFSPLVNIPLLNIIRCQVDHYPDFQKAEALASRGYAKLSYDPLESVNMSRAMYPAHFNSQMSGADRDSLDFHRDVEGVYYWAFKKFKGPVKDLVKISNPAHTIFSAILTCRLSARFVSYRTNSKMMQLHQGLATYLSEDGEVLTITYEGEPMTSIAAANTMYFSRDTMAHTINAMRLNLENSLMVIPDVGGVGELLVAFYCLMARDRHFRDLIEKKIGTENVLEDFGKPLLVSYFLSSLLSPQHHDFLKKCGPDIDGILMNSFTTFTSFVPLSKPQGKTEKLVTKRILLWALQSRAALYMPPNTAGIDIVIPIIVGKKEEGLIEMSVENVGAIVVQAKRHADYFTKTEIQVVQQGIRDSKKEFEDGIPIKLGILMNVGRGGLGSERRTAHVKFSDENVYTSDSFPIVSLSAKMVQKALALTPGMIHDLDEVVGLNPGPRYTIQRSYSGARASALELDELTSHGFSLAATRLLLNMNDSESPAIESPVISDGSSIDAAAQSPVVDSDGEIASSSTTKIFKGLTLDEVFEEGNDGDIEMQ